MKKYLITLAALCAAGSVFAAEYQIKSGGVTNNMAAFNVWDADSGAWVTATVAPGIDDTIAASTVTNNMTINSIVGTINLSTFSGNAYNLGTGTLATTPVAAASTLVGAAGSDQTVSGTLGVVGYDRIFNVSGSDYTVTATSMVVRGGISMNAGTLSLVGSASGATQLQLGYSRSMSVSGVSAETTYLEKNTAGKLALVVASSNDYSLGLVKAGGTNTAWREITLKPDVWTGSDMAALSNTVTVSGLDQNGAGSGFRFMVGGNKTTVAAYTGNMIDLVIDVAAGEFYTSAANFESTANAKDKLNIIKRGAGTQYILGGTSNNVSNGGLTVLEGTLFATNANGKGLGVGNMVVESGARLGLGNGASATTPVGLLLAEGNNLTVKSGGILQAGANDRRFALRSQSDIIMQDGSTLEFILGRTSGETQTLLGNTLIMDGATLTADDITISLLVSDRTMEGVYTIVSGLASDITANWTVTTSDPTHWLANMVYDSGSVNVTMSYIPEPSACAALIGLLGLAFVARRRR